MSNYGYQTNQSVAYDFDLFDAKKHAVTREERRRAAQQPPLRVIKTKKMSEAELRRDAREKAIQTVKAIFMSLTVVFMLSSLIFGQAKLIAVKEEANRLEYQLENLKQSHIDLESRINQKVASYDIDEYAKNNLGMIKLRNNQVTYFVFEEAEKNNSEIHN